MIENELKDSKLKIFRQIFSQIYSQIAMMILRLTTIVFLFCSYSAHPISKKTLNIKFAPEKALVINQGEKQLFRFESSASMSYLICVLNS